MPAADKNGLADPYVKIYCAGNVGSTQNEPQEKTLNPVWYKTIPIELSIGSFEAVPPIITYVWDWDRLSGDDLIGMLVTDISEASINSLVPAPPVWKKLNMGRDGSELGEILISFNLCDVGNVPSYDIYPEYDDVSIEISILGLRGLHPAVGFMPVNKAFIKFDLNSLRLTGGSLIKRELQTQPGEPGENPNINTVLSFTCKLPKDPLYCPALTCTVHDNLFAGMYQPLIGVFSLYLGDVIAKSKTSIKEVKKAVQEETKMEINPFKNSNNVMASLLIKNAVKIDNKQVMKDTSNGNGLVGMSSSTLKAEEKKLEVKEMLKSLSGIFGKKKPSEKDKETQPLIKKEEKDDSVVKSINSAIAQVTKQMNLPDSNRNLTLIEASRGFVTRYPVYKTNKETQKVVEVDIPDPKFYMGLGFSKTPGDNKKHYRFYINNELENSEYYGDSPFTEYEVVKGQSRGLDESIFDRNDHIDSSGQKTNSKVVGKFKGLVRITSKKYIDYKNKAKSITTDGINASNMMLLLSGMVEKDTEFDDISKKLLVKTPVTVRVYIVDAIDLAQKDRFSASDPYLKVSLGKVVYNLKNEYQEDQSNPKFYKFFSFETTLPGVSLLKIQVWDHNDVFADEKIGSTLIDLEDLFFSNK